MILKAILFAAAFCAFGVDASKAQTKKDLIDITPSSLSSGSLFFFPGVFTIDEKENKIIDLCIPSNGNWVLIGHTPTSCPMAKEASSPPLNLRYKVGSTPEGIPAIEIGNLGVDKTQWLKSQQIKNTTLVPNKNPLKEIGRAASLSFGKINSAISWQFDSRFLPPAMTAEIPGSGIFFHIQYRFRQKDTPFLFNIPNQSLMVKAKLSMPTLKIDGESTSTVTISVSMQTLDVNGRLQPILLIVDLFNSHSSSALNYVGSDGRNTFVYCPLNGASTYIEPQTGNRLLPLSNTSEVFSFLLTQKNILNVITSLNAIRQKDHLPPLSTNTSSVRLKGISLNNENRKLDYGNARIDLKIQHLQAISITE